MRVLEFTSPAFLGKARLISKDFKGMVDQFTSIYINCRIENFGYDMPPPPAGLTERQYSNLLGSKGCLSPGCDDKMAYRTHWSWAKRWCMRCWKSKIEREDRAIKRRVNRFGRSTLDSMLECIPFGMHDSFEKPHDIMDDADARGRNAPRLYKYYLTDDIEAIIAEYLALDPAPYAEDPTHTAEQKAAALAEHQALTNGLGEKRANFFAEKKVKNDKHMDQVKRIETGVRLRRDKNSIPYNTNRKARRELFTKRAQQQIGHIPTEFVQRTKAFKAATRIFRDGGTERGWQTLRPKIIKEWEKSKIENCEAANPANTSSPMTAAEHRDDNAEDDIMDDESIIKDLDDDDQNGTQSHTYCQSQTPNAPTYYSSTIQGTHLPRVQGAIRQAHERSQWSLAQDSNDLRLQCPLRYSMVTNPIGAAYPYSLPDASTIQNTISNCLPHLGRQNAYFSTNMPPSYPFGDHRPYPSSSQQAFINTNRNTLTSTQSINPSTRISISSLIQDPPARLPFADFGRTE